MNEWCRVVADSTLEGMWNWSRTTMADAAGFSSLVTLLIFGLAVWRFGVGDSKGGLAFGVIGLVSTLYCGLGWYFRKMRPEDPWEPW
jgi:hypothetical protein